MAAIVALLGACAAPPATSPAPAPAPVAAPAEPPPPPAPPATPQMSILRLEDAALNAADFAFFRAPAPASGAPATQVVVIDPLVDGVTGVQSNVTRTVESRVVEIARTRHQRFDVQPFTSATIARSPLILLGTLTGSDGHGEAGGIRETYRICLALLDLGSGTVLSKSFVLAQMTGADVTPVAYFNDSPMIVPTRASEKYARNCEGIKRGDTIDPAYRAGLPAEAIINEGVESYGAGKYREALEAFKRAVAAPETDAWRANNGIYLASVKLGRQADANRAFAKLVDFGFETSHFALKFAFKPGTSQFVADAKLGSAYREWLRQIAERLAKDKSCIDIVGHVGTSGTVADRERLSLQRAEFVKQRLDAISPQLKKRTKAAGEGSREALVGLGTDDAKDALDRRIELRITGC
jgi:outer membrane protein OmpA-like peptidoglycan-associated protein